MSPKSSPIVYRERITPTVAKRYLGENTSNRNIRENVVNKLAGALERDEWFLSNDAITFNGNGTLLNGQHRLHAIIKANKPATMLVLHGVPSEAQSVMDTGARRNLADMLKLRGETNPNMLAGAIRQVWYFEQGLPLASNKPEPSPQQIMAALDRHGDIRGCLNSAHELVRYHIPGPPTVYAALRYLFGLVDEQDARDFFGKLSLGSDLSADNPLFVLRRALVLSATNASQRKPRRWYAAVMVKSWNAYRRGDEVTAVMWRSGGASPEPFPKIDGLSPEDLR